MEQKGDLTDLVNYLLENDCSSNSVKLEIDFVNSKDESDLNDLFMFLVDLLNKIILQKYNIHTIEEAIEKLNITDLGFIINIFKAIGFVLHFERKDISDNYDYIEDVEYEDLPKLGDMKLCVRKPNKISEYYLTIRINKELKYRIYFDFLYT